MHSQQDAENLEPIVKKLLVREKRNKNFKKLENANGAIWLEISEVPSFNVKSEDKLMLPGHIFVREKVYKKIQEAGK